MRTEDYARIERAIRSGGLSRQKSRRIKAILRRIQSEVDYQQDRLIHAGMVALIAVTRIRAESGTPLGELVRFAADAGMEGIEFLAGIPGSVGGAVYGNAGAFGRSTSEFLDDALLLGPGDAEHRASSADLGFAYRHSALKSGRRTILEAVFNLSPGNQAAIRSRIDGCLALRAEKHPPRDMAYAGSFFKNPTLPDGTRQAAGRQGAPGRIHPVHFEVKVVVDDQV